MMEVVSLLIGLVALIAGVFALVKVITVDTVTKMHDGRMTALSNRLNVLESKERIRTTDNTMGYGGN